MPASPISWEFLSLIYERHSARAPRSFRLRAGARRIRQLRYRLIGYFVVARNRSGPKGICGLTQRNSWRKILAGVNLAMKSRFHQLPSRVRHLRMSGALVLLCSACSLTHLQIAVVASASTVRVSGTIFTVDADHALIVWPNARVTLK